MHAPPVATAEASHSQAAHSAPAVLQVMMPGSSRAPSLLSALCAAAGAAAGLLLLSAPTANAASLLPEPLGALSAFDVVPGIVTGELDAVEVEADGGLGGLSRRLLSGCKGVQCGTTCAQPMTRAVQQHRGAPLLLRQVSVLCITARGMCTQSQHRGAPLLLRLCARAGWVLSRRSVVRLPLYHIRIGKA